MQFRNLRAGVRLLAVVVVCRMQQIGDQPVTKERDLAFLYAAPRVQLVQRVRNLFSAIV
jgi:hypothetical protein